MKRPSSSLVIKLVKHVRARLLAGILVVVPLWLTYVALRFSFRHIDSFFAPGVKKWFGIAIPGLGFVLLFVFLYAIGVIARNMVGRSLIKFGESILNRIPLVKNIYQATKQLLEKISDPSTLGFQRAVLVEYPRPGLLAIGFVTNRVYDSKSRKTFVAVFIPTTPNPTSGLFELVPEDQVINTNMSIEEAIKIVVSGGLMLPSGFQIRAGEKENLT